MPIPKARACFISVRIGFFEGGIAVGGAKPITSSR
jgi:hypothetical protein